MESICINKSKKKKEKKRNGGFFSPKRQPSGNVFLNCSNNTPICVRKSHKKNGSCETFLIDELGAKKMEEKTAYQHVLAARRGRASTVHQTPPPPIPLQRSAYTLELCDCLMSSCVKFGKVLGERPWAPLEDYQSAESLEIPHSRRAV